MKAFSRTFFALSTVLILVFALGCNKSGNARDDQQVASDIQAKLSNDRALPNGSGITVNSNNGVVTLTGTVGSEAERTVATSDAQGVQGVKQVVNNLSVGSVATANPNEPVNDLTVTPQSPQPKRSTQARRPPASSQNRGYTPNTARSSASGEALSNTGPANTAPAAPAQVTVPSGSNLTVRTNEGLSSEKSQEGESFSGTLDAPIEVDGRIAIPQGAEVRGRVVEAKNAAHYTGSSLLALELTQIAYNGHSYRIVSNRWQKQGAARGKNTAAKVGGGAALGAIIGGIAGGGKGAAIGAGAGAAAGTGANTITRGQQVVVNPESLLSFTLQSPVTVTPASSNRDAGRQRLGGETPQ